MGCKTFPRERFAQRAPTFWLWIALGLSVVVKDAARGIEAGMRAVYPEAAQRDDRFHALYEMNKVRRRLEQRAYGAITEELEAEALRDPVVAEDLADRPDVEGAVP